MTPRKAGFRDFLAVTEIRTKAVSLSTLSLATLHATWKGASPRPVDVALVWAAALAVDMGTTAANNYFDWWRGTDSHREIDEPDKVLVHSGVSPGFALASALACFFAAACLGIAIAAGGRTWVIPAGAACMAVGFLYSGGPFPISRTPLGELFAGGCLGLALFSIACGAWGVPASPGMALAGLPSSLMIAAILTVNNTCDIAGDRAAGRRTLSILIGAKGGALVVAALHAASVLAAVAAARAGAIPDAVILAVAAGSAPMALKLAGMMKRGFSHATKGPNMGSVIASFLWFTFSILAGYAAALARG